MNYDAITVKQGKLRRKCITKNEASPLGCAYSRSLYTRRSNGTRLRALTARARARARTARRKPDARPSRIPPRPAEIRVHEPDVLYYTRGGEIVHDAVTARARASCAGIFPGDAERTRFFNGISIRS